MEHGTSNESPRQLSLIVRGLLALGRFIMFLVLAVPAMAIVAAVILLPAYQGLLGTQYQRDCLKSDLAVYESTITKRDQMIQQAPEDEQLTANIAMAQTGMVPKNVVVLYDPDGPKIPAPGQILSTAQPHPPKPSGLAMTMADKVQDPSTRRGLFLLAGMGMLAALFLFASDERQQGRKEDGPAAK